MSDVDRKLRIDPSVNLGVIIQSLLLLGAILWFVVGKASTADQAQIELKAFRTEVAAQFYDVKQQIAGIPDQRAAAVQVERRMGEVTGKNTEQDQRLSTLEQTTYKMQAEITNIQHTLTSKGAKQ